jgi:hypothetical protein
MVRRSPEEHRTLIVSISAICGGSEGARRIPPISVFARHR